MTARLLSSLNQHQTIDLRGLSPAIEQFSQVPGWRSVLRIWPCDEALEVALFQQLTLLSATQVFIEQVDEAQQFIELYIAYEGEDAAFNSSLSTWLSELPINYCVQTMTARKASHKPALMLFDMDSTLIQMECIDELARRHGLFEQVASITESAMRGELDFEQSLRKRVALLKGLPVSAIDELADALPLTKGLKELVKIAKQNNIYLAIVSGGFVPFVERLKQDLAFDFARANQLEARDGVLTGGLIGTIVDAEKKRETLLELCHTLGIDIERGWAIGDGANDLKMMSAAGLGIAFDAKPKVRQQATAGIWDADMTDVIRLLK
ncbi:phosphoserine phosphatase SerB [Pleionea sp. CnH1-48]|uniref:phosphoserine phosphatase SerB n=1 Tax=Pleionea sp. CnH1-48 TaxID=2954494 RepID=UPI002097FD7F|nr:phosphoserine phosphatase SerB [Pleionea sp. CnH1-48]MCO7227420.1 phosphoserine phosphatase SerB [Pleionea sp. CnH1-48]